MSKFEQFDWYRDPKYYDIVFDVDSSVEAAFLEAVRKKYVLSKGSWALEPACGSGRLLAELAARGYKVCGFDSNPSMLAQARKRLRRHGVIAKLKRMDFADFSFGKRKFDLAFCLVNSFKTAVDTASASAGDH